MKLFTPKTLRTLLVSSAVAISVAACSSDDGVALDANALGKSVSGDAQTLPTTTAATTATATGNIVTTAVEAGSFTTLVAALETTGLDSVLADETRQFTVFAPTDEAFEKLGQDTINTLLNDTNTLSDILLYHVLPDAAVNAASAIGLAGSMVTTANGDDIALTLNDGALFINMSEVIVTDIETTNGIIHVIDTVLTPPADEPTDTPLATITDTAVAAGSFNTLVTALQATGLDATLASNDDTFTVFAPTDDAFAALGSDTINALLNDTETLSDILLYHVIGGQAVDAMTALTLAGNSVTMANGDTVELSLRDGALFINDAQVVTTDILASNGIIHVIDTVLLPPAEDVPADVPPLADEPATETVYAIARDAGFDTLIAAVDAAGLKGALDHPGDIYTVFAPTDEAFAALGSDTIAALLDDPDTLRDILLFHVLPGTVVDAATAVELIGLDITAGNGGTLVLTSRDDGLYINDSRITVTDIRAVNGVIHVIDAVLIP